MCVKRKIFLPVLCVLGLAGCVATAPTSTTTAPEPVLSAQEKAQQAARAQRLEDWLQAAYQALDNDRLMVPAEGSAYQLFLQVLELEPNNMEARRGMRLITRRYMSLAEEALRRDERARAELLLSRALMISALPSEVDELRQRYPERAPAANERRLPSDLLAQRGDAIRQLLAEVAVEARAIESRLVIVARSDAEGRWIYRQMREAVPGYRLRGNIEVASQPRIILMDMSAGEL